MGNSYMQRETSYEFKLKFSVKSVVWFGLTATSACGSSWTLFTFLELCSFISVMGRHHGALWKYLMTSKHMGISETWI